MNRLRSHKYLRTNQFDVKNQLYGYEERFRIQDREGLADALQERLDLIYANETKWTPEVLHFILELADKPTQKSKLADLDRLREKRQDPGLKLTWKQIAREDGWYDEKDIWRRPNFADSSGDEAPSGIISDDDSEVSQSIENLGAESAHLQHPEDHIVATDGEALLHKVQLSQFWRVEERSIDAAGRPAKIPISEFQAVREVLFLFSGLRTTLFGPEGAISPRYQITMIANDTQGALLGKIAESGKSLQILRAFAARSQQIPLTQVFRACIQNSLSAFDKHITAIQQRLIVISQDTVISLVRVLEDVRPWLQKLASLSGIVQRLQDEAHCHPFRYLELLFDETKAAQLSASDSIYRFLGQIFCDCFKVYMRPIRLWMEEGKLMSGDKTFFISEAAVQVPLNQVWQNQFKLRRTSDGTLHAPRFLCPAAHKIFTAGKSVVVLKNLGKFESAKTEWSFEEPKVDFDSVCSQGMEFAPFSELFNAAFDQWVQRKHHAAAATLQKSLFDSCGLWDALEALERVFFMSDGSLSVAFASGLFEHLDGMNPEWHDRFTLTEIAQQAFSSGLDPDRLVAHATPSGQKCSLELARSSVKHSLTAIKLTYKIPWSVQLVLLSESISSYQSIFALLLQVRRAILIINKHRMLLDLRSEERNHEEHCKYYALRARLVWFCELFHTYLATFVIAPGVEKMRRDLRAADDVDSMITVHSKFLKDIVDECCLGNKLKPIHECILDVFDLCIRLSDAQKANAAREEEEMEEISRLSLMASPVRTPSKRERKGDGQRTTVQFVNAQDAEDEETMQFSGGMRHPTPLELEQPYMDVLRDIQNNFDGHMRFITSGLRGVARASSDTASSRWDMLAEMLEMGSGGQGDTFG